MSAASKPSYRARASEATMGSILDDDFCSDLVAWIYSRRNWFFHVAPAILISSLILRWILKNTGTEDIPLQASNNIVLCAVSYLYYQSRRFEWHESMANENCGAFFITVIKTSTCLHHIPLSHSAPMKKLVSSEEDDSFNYLIKQNIN